jgi:hypothetical protein
MIKKMLILFSLLSICFLDLNAQELSGGADIMSRYVWRGRDFGNSPSIQPCIEFSVAGFTLGTWGAFSTNSNNFQEHDIYLSYSFLDMFSIGVTDYFFPAFPLDHFGYKNKYFDYAEETTNHYIEANLSFGGTESFPVSLSANMFFYGADAKPALDPQTNEEVRGDQYYSTYLEVGYSGELSEANYDLFLGVTTGEGLYGTTFGVVNLGITVNKDVKITDDFSLPVQASFITNPQDENIYFVFGISL